MAEKYLKNRDNAPRASASLWLICLAAVTTLFLPFHNALAVDAHWTGATSTDYATGTNWSTGASPGITDNAVFDGTFTNQPTVNVSGNDASGALWMTGAVGQDVTLGVAARQLSLNGTTLSGTANVGLLVDNANAFKLTIVCDLKLTTVANAITFINNSANVVTIGQTVGGGTTLNLNNEVLTIDGPGNFLINAQVASGGGSLVKNGNGILTLTGNNNYGSGTTINAGTVVANTATSLGQSGKTVTINAGTLEVAASYSDNRNIVLGSANSTIQVDPTFTFTSSGIISGSGSLNKTGNGTMILGSKANTYSGATNVIAGTLQDSASQRLANTSNLNVSGGTFDVQTFSETVATVSMSSGAITGTGTGTVTGTSYAFQSGTATAILGGTGATLTKTTSGTVTLSGANTFTGATTVSGGTLTLASTTGSALGTTASVTVNSGGTVLLGASNQINNTAPMTLAGGTFAKGNFAEGTPTAAGIGALTLTAAGSHIDFGTGTVGVLSFASFTPGAFTLTVDNWTGTGATVGSSSTDRLIFNSDQSANLSSFSFTGFAPGAVEFNLGSGFFEVVPVTPIPEPSTLIAAALAAGVAGWYLVRRRRGKSQDTGSQLFAMPLLRLAVVTALCYPAISAQADNESWTGAVDSRWGDNSNWNARQPGANDNALFDGFFRNQPTLSSNDSVAGIWMTGNLVPDVTISSSSDVLTLRESLGLGLLVDNTNGSKLTIATDLKLGSDQSWVNNSSNVVNITGEADLNNKVLTIAGPGNFQIDGVISNHGILPHQDAITLTGTGFRAFAGANTYDGLTTINGGTLIIENSTGLGLTDGGTIVASGAQLELTGGFGALTIGNEALTLNGTGNAADLSTGAGALRNLGGNNSFAGQITLGSDSTIICGGSTLTLSGGIVNGGFTVTFGGDSNIVESGVISGGGALIKNDTGTLALNGISSYSGGSTINGGTVIITNSSSLGLSTGSATINDAALEAADTITTSRDFVLGSANSTVKVDPTFTLTTTGVISGTGALNKNGNGTMVLSGANTFTDATTVNAGTLTLSSSSGSALGSTSSVTVNSGGTMLLGASNQINDTAPMTLAGGTFAKGDFSEGSASTPGVGALTLTASGSHIDFGSGAVGVLTFASFAPGAFTLTIDNWSGTANMVGDGSTDRLVFASDQSGNLNSFFFTGFGSGAVEFDLGGGFWEVVPTAIPEPSTWAAAGLAAGVAGWCLLRRRHSGYSAQLSARKLLITMCAFPLLAVAAPDTAREDIVRAVAAATDSDVSQAAPKEFLQAFTVVALRVDPEDLPKYVSAAIRLRPDLAPKAVPLAMKAAVKTCEQRPQILGTTVEGIVKASIAAKPDAVIFIVEAGASTYPQLRDYVVSAAIAAAPEAKEAILEAARRNNMPYAFLTFSVSGTSGFSYRSATQNPASISKPGNVISPEKPPSH